MPEYPIELLLGSEDAYAEARGCEDFNNSEFYAYTNWEGKYHACFKFFSQLTIKAGETYRQVQHYLIGEGCKEGKCLCVAYPRNPSIGYVVVNEHEAGECPLSTYDDCC